MNETINGVEADERKMNGENERSNATFFSPFLAVNYLPWV